MNRRSLLTGVFAIPLAAGAASAEAPAGLEVLELASGWIGERPAPSSLRGRAVVIDVFTFECINCRNVTPNLKHLYARYPRGDVAVVGVHTPEVPSYQKSIAYLTQQTRAAGLPWPIAIDNDHRIWDAYGVLGWPTQLIFDRSGRLRSTIAGDGQDQQVTAAVRAIVRGA